MEDTREKLILTGLDHIREYGVGGMSLRKVATACGVSCAAPYKHFADKSDLFRAMVDYVNLKWEEEASGLSFTGSTQAERAAEYGAAFIDFLHRNPHYKSVLMIKQMGLDSPGNNGALGLSLFAKRRLAEYRRATGIDRGELRQRLFVARTFVYGAVFTVEKDGELIKERVDAVKKALVFIFS